MANEAIQHKKTGSVSVKFVGDEEVIDNIISISKNLKGISLKDGKHYVAKKVGVKSQRSDSEHDDDDDAAGSSYYKPSALLDHDEDEIQRNGAIATANGELHLEDDPARTLKRKTSAKAAKTPQHQSNTPKQNASTTYNLRSKLRDESSENSDDDSSQDSSSSDEDTSPQMPRAKGSALRHKKRTPQKGIKSMAEDYFLMNQRTPTSNRTLSSTSLTTDQESVKKMRKDIGNRHAKHVQELMQRYYHHFHKWNEMLREGFNLLFYGIGSKYSLLNAFCKEVLEDSLHVVVNGFFPAITLKNVLNCITDEVIEDSGSYQSLNDKANFIKDYFNTPDAPHLYLVIHNIDGTSLRSQKAQAALSELAQARNIHMIASIDHVNSSLLWDEVMLSRFQWVLFEVPTFQPYIMETSYEDSLLAQHTGQLKLSSLFTVFHSLTSNAQGIFLIIANHQVANSEKRKYIGLSFQECYQQCGEAFLVSSDLALKTQLIEFKDHKLLQMKKGPDGVDYLHIPLDNDTLKQFLEDEKKS